MECRRAEEVENGGHRARIRQEPGRLPDQPLESLGRCRGLETGGGLCLYAWEEQAAERRGCAPSTGAEIGGIDGPSATRGLAFLPPLVEVKRPCPSFHYHVARFDALEHHLVVREPV